ncbi:MAG TPA: sugar transferase [Verrucomicrobiae bacterium]|jgi:exopolysaccharide biosynthesis polyprenyl glycosylphosphotransferase
MYQGKNKTFKPFSWMVIGDVIAIAASFILTPYVIEQKGWVETIPSPLECIFYGGVILFNFRVMKLYCWGTFTLFKRIILRLIMALSLSALYFIILRFIFLENSQSRVLQLMFNGATQQATRWLDFHWRNDHGIRDWVGVQLFMAFLLVLLVRHTIYRFFSNPARKLSIERIAFIGWNTKLNIILNVLSKERGPFLKIAGFFHRSDTDDSAIMAAMHGYRVLGEVSNLEAELNRHQITSVLIDSNDVSSAEEKKQIAEITARNLISLEIIQSTFDVWATQLGVRVTGGVPVIGIVYQMQHERLISRLLKRVLDIGCALFGLLVSAPVIAVLGAMVYLESPGPIFYRQTRLGLGGKEFQIIKLRSMKLNADNVPGGGWTVKDDPRRLRIGKFMRSWNIDELPQFWNVLKGEMSMVGPRPERPGLVNDFKYSIRYYNLRLTCKAGLTGWAAVHGLRGDTSIEGRLAYDLHYIENWSLWLDIKIMFMTLVPPENAY